MQRDRGRISTNSPMAVTTKKVEKNSTARRPHITPFQLSSSMQNGSTSTSSEQSTTQPIFTPRSSRVPSGGETIQLLKSPTALSPKNEPLTENSPRPTQQAPAETRHRPWANKSELKVFVRNLPPGCDTRQIFECLQHFGTIIRIDISGQRRNDRTDAYVNFKPPPKDTAWVSQGIQINDKGKIRFVNFEVKPLGGPFYQPSPIDPERTFADQTTVSMSEIGFGTMKTEKSMLEFTTVKPTASTPVQLVLNLQRKALDVRFPLVFPPLRTSTSNAEQERFFMMRVQLTQIKSVIKVRNESTREIALVFTTLMPPFLHRKTQNLAATHEQDAVYWNEWQAWYRQTSISQHQDSFRTELVQLQKQDAIIDIGRWLTYKMVFSASASVTKEFNEICEALHHHNITIRGDRPISIESSRSEHLWNWLDNPTSVSEETADSSALLELHQMAVHTIHLRFEVRYQLEACISIGILHECNIDDTFLTRLAGLEPDRAVKLLEKVADEKERFFNPSDIFPRLLHKASVVRERIPKYCASIRSATITPTTVYFMQPATETSNSIIRKYQHLEDRFLRVKFTDEKYKGKIMSCDGRTMDEVYTRVKRAMTNGINVGGRNYEFLAFGNSQFREGGAYFFAPTGSLTAQDIRNAMGDFSRVDRTVAKYCARVGQAFSTTRTFGQKTLEIEEIPDIVRRGHCFTDGVGKISPFLAQMIAQEQGLPGSTTDYPSVFQFRLGGCKGVLAVDPSLKGKTIQIRPSQRKFEIPDQRLGLDICRISQLSTAYLNMQLILVLSTLGVEDDVFLDKMDHMLKDLSTAMKDEQKAIELLQRNIDFNQMTIQLAHMIFEGFMETQDPFMMSCLRLWRAWSIKYLKEKARIYVEHGAFVLGCVDETAILKGHFNDGQATATSPKDEASLPEIFLRVESPPFSGKWTVITGICIIARNPSLHPGDVRVVRAVDKPELYHYRNCVVTPQTGDRDIPNMCSGGDLDGDDYLVIWDKDLLPEEWNHPAMNFEGAKPEKSDGPVKVDHMTSFFVTYMKHDNLSRIAVAHRYWADARPDGVKDPKCLELANLHSTAVDYMKTGVPAKLPRHLRITQWPHWADAKNKSKSKIYTSRKILGRLYDKVQRADMQPQWDCKFDSRILQAYELDNAILDQARKAKQEYDTALLRIMAKFSIKTEFEVWTTFVMEHASDFGDYKFVETIGEETYVLKDHHQHLCMEVVGTDKADKEYMAKMGPFVAAMYKVTAQELEAALEECKKMKLVRGLQVPVREKTAETMPFISFPWLFPRELGIIANKGPGRREDLAGLQASIAALSRKPKKPDFDHLGGDYTQEPLPEVKHSGLSSHGEQSLDLPLVHRAEAARSIGELPELPSVDKPRYQADGSEAFASSTRRDSPIMNETHSSNNGVTDRSTGSASTPNATVVPTSGQSENVERKVPKEEEEEPKDKDHSGEGQQVTFPIKSPLDALAALIGTEDE